MRLRYVVAAAVVVAGVPLGLLFLDDAMAREARETARDEHVCYCPDPLARPSSAAKLEALGLGVAAVLFVTWLVRTVRAT
jgi:hypothetical protein